MNILAAHIPAPWRHRHLQVTAMSTSAPQTHFTRLDQTTRGDWQILGGEFLKLTRGLPERIIAHLNLLHGDFGGFPIDRHTHSLQTATLALRDGRDEEYVVCALLHDIGDTLGSFNHPDVAATILQPFENCPAI
jgi:hypothetical protein